jgi:hypothetical protein
MAGYDPPSGWCINYGIDNDQYNTKSCKLESTEGDPVPYPLGTFCPRDFNSTFSVSSYYVGDLEVRKIMGFTVTLVVYRDLISGKCGIYNAYCGQWIVPDMDNVVLKNAKPADCMKTYYPGIALIQDASAVFKTPEPSFVDVFQWDFTPVETYDPALFGIY